MSRAVGRSEVLTIRLDEETFSLPIGAVREVLYGQALTRLPHAPPSLLGLANHRGMALPVVALARLLRRDAQAATPAARILVLEGETPIGLLVDSVVAFDAGGTPLDGLDSLLAQEFSALSAHPRRAAGRRGEPMGGDARAAPEELAVVTCEVAGQEYALAVDQVVAVARLPDSATLLPQRDAAMLGVVPFDDGLLPLVSAQALLGLRAGDMDRTRARILVLPLGAALVGLVVDRTGAVLRLPKTAIDPVPAVLTRGSGEARVEAIGRVEGGRRLVALLSPATLFDAATTARLLADAGRESEMAKGEAAAAEAEAAIERFLVFRLGEEEYGLPINAVEEVVRRPAQLTRVPQAPDYLDGVMQLRGTVIPVIDQRRRFAAGQGMVGSRRVIILEVAGLRAGFAVDAVTEVLSVPAAALAPAPSLAASGQQIFDRVAFPGEGGRMILLIDPQALLDAAERDLLAALAATARPGA